MSSVLRALKIVFKAICFICLAFALSGIGAMVLVDQMGGCPRLDEGSIQCNSDFYRSIGTYGISVVYILMFTGLPALFALIGVVLLIRLLLRSWRAWRAPQIAR